MSSDYSQISELLPRFARSIYLPAAGLYLGDVRFLMVALDLLTNTPDSLGEGYSNTFMKVIDDINAWGLRVLRVDKNDYIKPHVFTNRTTLLHGVWIVGEKEGLLLFNLKYKNLIIINVDEDTMSQYFKLARIGSRPTGYSNTVNIDFMNELVWVTAIRKAIESYAFIGRPVIES